MVGYQEHNMSETTKKEDWEEQENRDDFQIQLMNSRKKLKS